MSYFTSYFSNASLMLTASAANLKRLLVIRLILIICLLLALAYAYSYSQADMIHPAYLSLLAVFSLINMLSYWRLLQPWPVTDTEYFCQILIDIIGLSVVLYFSGGASNPFVSYYLVPLTISATVLPWRFTWLIAGLSLLAYSLLLFFYQPLPSLQPIAAHHPTHGGDSGINLHIIGMWITFTLSTCLITYYVVKMAHALRQQEQNKITTKEESLRDEQILAVATLAAGTAHELGTPLNTMTVLLDELEQEYQQPELKEDLHVLQQQLQSCRTILQGLVSTADAHNPGHSQTINIVSYIQHILDHWQVLRPEVNYQLHIDSACSSIAFEVDPTLQQAISNLLNNAADADPNAIVISLELELQKNQQTLLLSIRDHGAGIAFEIAEQIGKPFVSTKGKGLGLGLFLSHATIERYGGSIALFNHPEGGTLAELRLPVKQAQR